MKNNGYYKYIGVDTGMNHIIRPSLYGSYHKIVNASKPSIRETEEMEKYIITG